MEEMSNIYRLPCIFEKEAFSHLVSKAASALKNGGVIGIPTDTIYGIAALAQNTDSVKKLYDIKGRSETKPVAICVSELDDIPKWGKVDIPIGLLSELLPGPVTLLFERQKALNPELNPDAFLVGIRIPDHPFVRALVRECKEPIALTSANVSGGLSTLAIEEFSELWPHLSAVFDGRRIPDSLEAREGSTIVDLSVKGLYKITRNGCAYKNTRVILEKYGLMPVC